MRFHIFPHYCIQLHFYISNLVIALIKLNCNVSIFTLFEEHVWEKCGYHLER